MSAGYVYVLAFTNGTVKVGRTQDTGKRLSAHKSDARKYGLTVTDQWLSPPHAEWLENEEALKKIAASLGGTAHRKEYFSGVNFAAVVEEARELHFTAPPAERTAALPPAGNSGQIAVRQAAADERDEWETLMTDLAHDLLNRGVSLGRARTALAACPTAGPPLTAAMEDILRIELRLIQDLLKEAA